MSNSNKSSKYLSNNHAKECHTHTQEKMREHESIAQW